MSLVTEMTQLLAWDPTHPPAGAVAVPRWRRCRGHRRRTADLDGAGVVEDRVCEAHVVEERRDDHLPVVGRRRHHQVVRMRDAVADVLVDGREAVFLVID